MIYSDRLRRHASVLGEHIAVVAGNEQLTYRDLLDQVNRLAEKLGKSGIKKTDTAGVHIKPEVEHLITTLALMMVGANQVVLASFDTPTMHEIYCDRVGVTVVISDDGYMTWRNRNSARPDHPEAMGSRRMVESGTLYFRTSGTTGEPNIVPLNEQQLALQAERHAEYSDQRALRFASIEHNDSKRHRLYCLWSGGTNVFLPDGRPDVKKFIEYHRITCLDVSRMHLSDLLEMPVGNALSKVKLRTGGTAVPYSLRKMIQERVSENLYVRYATTECGAISIAVPSQHDPEDSVGVPLDGVRLEIVNESDCQSAQDEYGEIRIRAGGMAEEYLDAPELTSRRFRGGWFYPGDMGYIRSDGCLVVKGRKDDMLILNGVNVFPLELERVLENHPSVHTAAVIGLPSKHHGDIPVAAVELHAGYEVSPVELKMYSRERLGLRTPRRIITVDRLPRNTQGKVVKKSLRELFLNHRADRKDRQCE